MTNDIASDIKRRVYGKSHDCFIKVLMSMKSVMLGWMERWNDGNNVLGMKNNGREEFEVALLV